MQFLKDFDLNVLLDKISSFLKLARNWRIILGNLSRGRLTFFSSSSSSPSTLFFLLTLQARRNIFKSSGDKQNLLGGHNLPPPLPTVCWNGVLCGHFLGIKTQHWNKCLRSLLSDFVGFWITLSTWVKEMPGKS